MSVFTGTKKRKARMILICRYFVLVCVVVFVCVLCVHGVCRLHSVCCVCLCLLKMNKNLMWTTGEKTCLIVISLRKQKSHVEQKTKRLGTAHLQNEYQQKSRMDRKRGKVCMRLMFSTITDVFVASIWKVVISLGMFTIAVMACLFSKVFGHSHHKHVRKSLRAENFAPQTCSCWPPFRAMDFAAPQQMRPQNIGISPR